jgi:YbbR domain-containing protein
MKIYGEDKALNTIDTLYTEALEWTDVSDTVVRRVPLAVPKGMRAEADSVDVSIVTERFTEKKLIVPLQVKNAPEKYRIRLFPKEVEVNVRVGMAHFAQVQPTDITAVCVYSPERKETMDVEISYTNSYITSAWAYPCVVEYLLEQ